PGGGPLPVPPGPPDRPPPEAPGAHDRSPEGVPPAPQPPDRPRDGLPPGPLPAPGGGGGGGLPGDVDDGYDPAASGSQVDVEDEGEQRRIQELLRRIREVRPRDPRSESEAVQRLESYPPEAFSPVLAPRKET